MSLNWEPIVNKISTSCVSIAYRLLAACFVFFVGRFLIRFLIRHFPKGFKRVSFDSTARHFLISATQGALYVVLAVTIIGILGIPLASTITVVGSIGAAVALALQGSLGNLASGFMLLIFKPMRLGDYIAVNGEEGHVTDLGIFYTTLTTYDNRHITLPNSSLTNTAIINYTAEKNRRVDLTIGVDYSSDVEQVKAVILTAIAAQKYVLQNPAPTVRLNSFGDSSLNFSVRCWCPSADYWDTYFNVNEAIRAALEENRISIPFPQVDVHVK